VLSCHCDSLSDELQRICREVLPDEILYLPRMNKQNIFLWIARFEGLSFLVLLGVAMPLKYLWGMPTAVRVVGMAHGVLFMCYVLLVFLVCEERHWGRVTLLMALLASVVPAGTFLFERRYLRDYSE
jgi:integral membrane protein